MALVTISDELKELMDIHKETIKDEYITYKLFVDSAVRDKLRRMKVAAGEDEVIKHLKKLQASRSRHLDRQAVKRTVTRHKLRMARNRRNMDII